LQEKYGFVYIWYDRKRKMYYIGSHWGTEDDGYICSSTRMRNAYRRRPNDFKRRILSRVYSDRHNMLCIEECWLLKVKNRTKYYNKMFFTTKGTWWVLGKPKGPMSEDTKRKISLAKKGKSNHRLGKKLSNETKNKISASHTGKIQAPTSEVTKKKLSDMRKGKAHTKEHNLNVSLGKMKSYQYLHEDIIYTTNNLKEFCEEHGLVYNNMSKLNSGKLQKYRGWSILRDN
jgi:hypothetical protein